MVGTVLLVLCGLFIAAQIWRGLRMMKTQTMHRFQFSDQATRPYAFRDHSGGRKKQNLVNYAGKSEGERVVRLGRQLVGLSMIALIGWILLLVDTLQDSSELGQLAAIGLLIIFVTLGIIRVVDFMGQRHASLRRLM